MQASQYSTNHSPLFQLPHEIFSAFCIEHFYPDGSCAEHILGTDRPSLVRSSATLRTGSSTGSGNAAALRITRPQWLFPDRAGTPDMYLRDLADKPNLQPIACLIALLTLPRCSMQRSGPQIPGHGYSHCVRHWPVTASQSFLYLLKSLSSLPGIWTPRLRVVVC